MNPLSKAYRVSLMLIAAILLAGLAGCQPEGLVYDPQSGQWVSPLPTATPPTSPLPTAIGDEVDPTLPPSPTAPPVPTLLPTPVVTPIPTAVPPIIPEVVGKAQQPFWIIYWQGNEVWRIDDQGKERQLLIDTYGSLGLYLTANPYLESLVDTSEQSRVKVSPDGQKLALVVVDKPGLVQQMETFTFSIYLFDIQTGDLKFLSEGASPEWSPDSKRIAFVQGPFPGDTMSDGSLWIADLDTGQIYSLAKGDPTVSELRVSYWTWSPDGQQIAFMYSEGMIDKPEIWIGSVVAPSAPYLVPNIPASIYYWCFSWTPDGQRLLCGVRDEGPGYPVSLWTVSVKTGERKQLTQDFYGGGGPWSPDGKWLAFSAIRLYEREDHVYDVWLLSADGAKLLRVTSTPSNSIEEYWSPDGTRLVFRREGVGLVVLSLETGEVASLGVNLVDLSSYNYAVGGGK